MRYSYLQISIFALICSIVVGCVTAPQPTIFREIIIFDYNPLEDTTAGSSNVTFAVVGTQVAADTYIPENSLFSDFADNMTKDFMEILTARGFGVRGPFNTYDEMNFPDKKDSDLILTAEFGISLDTNAVRFKYYANKWHAEGPVVVKGSIYLVVSESLTNERMWSKKVPITPFRVQHITPTEPHTFGTAYDLKNMKRWESVEIEQVLIQYEAVPPDWTLPVVDAVYRKIYYGGEPTEEQLAQRKEQERENELYNKQVERRHRAIANIRTIPWQMLIEQNAFYNALGKSLQSQYYEIMNKTYGYLNPEEMKIVKNQSIELRNRKVY